MTSPSARLKKLLGQIGTSLPEGRVACWNPKLFEGSQQAHPLNTVSANVAVAAVEAELVVALGVTGQQPHGDGSALPQPEKTGSP